jgi:hypothetical protein
MLSAPLMTREQARVFLVQQGFPIGKSTFDKLCSPAKGEGPPVAVVWPGQSGSRPLYQATAVLEWARSRRPSNNRKDAA